MIISEAIKKATKENVGIRRSTWDNDLIVIPTNSISCCVIGRTSRGNKLHQRWNPAAEDLMATDWEIYN